MMIIGEAWGEQEELYEAPFVGASGFLLRKALSISGVDMDDCYLTNVFNFRPAGNNIETLLTTRDHAISGYEAYKRGKYVDVQYESELGRLWEEIEEVNPNVILGLGATAAWALCNVQGIQQVRGFVMQTFKEERKVICSWHPAAVLRNYKLFPVMAMDIEKAVRHDETPDIPPQVGYLCVPSTIEELKQWYETHIKPAAYIICDIETEKDTITEIGFSVSKERAICIPFFARPNKSYWASIEDEKEAWRIVREICSTKNLVGQNFAYDMKWLWMKMGIPCPGFVDDTMLLHHSLQPEMEKGLSFLASLYTDRPVWKFMRASSKTSKKGD